LWVSRPISWPNTAYPFAAGYLAVTQAVDARLIIGTLFFLIPYNLVMYGINDVFDYESDIRNPRKGGIEGAAAAKKLHKPIVITATATSVPFLIALLILGNLAANITLLVVMFFVLAYSVAGLRFKEKPVLDSVTSSIHFVGPLVYALTLTEFSTPAWLIVAAFFLWGMASHAFGAVQDIIPDREGGISSIATVFGAKATVRLVIALYLLSGLLLIPLQVPGLLAIIYIANVWGYRNITDSESGKTNVAWRRFIYLNLFAGFAVTMLLLSQLL
jgi:4-hydroxybenzoate polyprenyltransferase